MIAWPASAVSGQAVGWPTSWLLAILQDEPERRAFSRFGKGRHPAALNFGDCFAYALARALGEPLLYKGDDFARTDIEAAVHRPGRGKKG